jgi:hypothetical protein
MDNYGYHTLTIDTAIESCTYDNFVVDDVLQKEMMDAETEDQIMELSVERLYLNLKESIKL